MTASVILKQNKKYNKLTMKFRMLMGQLQKVDVTLVIEPVIAGNKKRRWEKSSEIPFNFTDLGAAIKVAGNARFEKVKPWVHKAKNTDRTEAALIDLEVYLELYFSCNQDPETILDAIRIEWRRQGGQHARYEVVGLFRHADGSGGVHDAQRRQSQHRNQRGRKVSQGGQRH